MKSSTDRELLTGWGRAAPSAAEVVRPRSRSRVEELISGDGSQMGERLVARGLGRSYGDAAQSGGGVVIDCNELDAVLEFDEATGRLRAEGGVSFDSLLKMLVPKGFFLPVTPGTRFVTLGGAIASDIHGKNHHVDGSLARYIEQLTLVTPTGTISCGCSQHEEEFAATCGGMGLTGVVIDATMRLIPIETSKMLVDTERAKDLDACMAMLADEYGRYRYSVAWIDGAASGARLGRSVLTRADHAKVSDLPARRRPDPLAYRPVKPMSVPFSPPVSLLNPLSLAAFNEMWYRKAPRRRIGQLQPLAGFFYPLDSVGRWNVLYGPKGFTQYQFAVPFGAEAVVRTALERLSAARAASFLSVLKCFGPAGSGHLSFPFEGWTLALDVPLGSGGLADVLDDLDLLVAEAGGRVYLSKDGRMRPELLESMYPRLRKWQAIRDRLDPAGVLGSDLSRRLGLTGSGRHNRDHHD